MIDIAEQEMQRCSVRVSKEVNEYFDEKSKRTGVSKSVLMYQALEHYLMLSKYISAESKQEEIEKVERWTKELGWTLETLATTLERQAKQKQQQNSN